MGMWNTRLNQSVWVSERPVAMGSREEGRRRQKSEKAMGTILSNPFSMSERGRAYISIQSRRWVIRFVGDSKLKAVLGGICGSEEESCYLISYRRKVEGEVPRRRG